MRSLEVLINLFPHKTGLELLEIQKLDKLEDEENYRNKHKDDLAIIDDINQNGGFYKLQVGDSQYYYYSFTNLKLVDDFIRTDVEILLLFYPKDETINLELSYTNKTNQNFKHFCIEHCEKVTKECYDKAIDSVNHLITLWY